MKKILFGLAAMSTLAFSAIDLGSAANETNVWETGTNGKILVNGRVTSKVPIVKYVAYASADGQYTPDGNELTLPDFIISTKSNEGGFDGAVQKIYVKRVATGDTGVEELASGDDVSFKIDFNSLGYTSLTSIWLAAGQYVDDGADDEISPFCLIPKTEMESILTNVSGVGINAFAFITQGSNFYKPTKILMIGSPENGVFEFKDTTYSFRTPQTSESYINQIETAFAAGKVFTGVPVLVKVD